MEESLSCGKGLEGGGSREWQPDDYLQTVWDKSRLRLVCRLSQVSTHLVIGLKEEIYGKN